MNQMQTFQPPGIGDAETAALRKALAKIVRTLAAHPPQEPLDLDLLESLQTLGPLPTPAGPLGADANVKIRIARLNHALELMPSVAGVGTLDPEWAEVLGAEIRDLVERLDRHLNLSAPDISAVDDDDGSALPQPQDVAPETKPHEQTAPQADIAAEDAQEAGTDTPSDLAARPEISGQAAPQSVDESPRSEEAASSSEPQAAPADRLDNISSGPFSGPIPTILRRQKESDDTRVETETGEPKDKENIAIPAPSGRPLPPFPQQKKRWSIGVVASAAAAVVAAAFFGAFMLGLFGPLGGDEAGPPKSAPDGARPTKVTARAEPNVAPPREAPPEPELEAEPPPSPLDVAPREVETAPAPRMAPEPPAPPEPRRIPMTNLPAEALEPPPPEPPPPVAPRLAPERQPPPQAPAPPSLSSAHGAQIGSYKSEALARSAWTAFKASGGAAEGLRHEIERADLGTAGIYYRLKIGPFDSRESASGFCARLKSEGRACIIVSPAQP